MQTKLPHPVLRFVCCLGLSLATYGQSPGFDATPTYQS